MMRFYSQRIILVLGLAAWCLVLAFVKFHALWPYQLSSWAICALCVMLGIQAEGWRKALLLVLAVIYNPIQPIHFGDAWQAVNLLSAGLFISMIVDPDMLFRWAVTVFKVTRLSFLWFFYILGGVLSIAVVWQIIKRGEAGEFVLALVGLFALTLVFVAFLEYIWYPFTQALQKRSAAKAALPRPVDFTDDTFDRVFPWALGVIFLVIVGVCIALHFGISKS